MDGYEATRCIREVEAQTNKPRNKILAFTANVMPEDRQKCIDAGMVRLISFFHGVCLCFCHACPLVCVWLIDVFYQDDYIGKPVQDKPLLEKLRQLVPIKMDALGLLHPKQ
jgi:CheY-like chemotaxis protein